MSFSYQTLSAGFDVNSADIGNYYTPHTVIKDPQGINKSDARVTTILAAAEVPSTPLYDEIDEYNKKHSDLISAYEARKDLPKRVSIPQNPKETYFRRQLIQTVQASAKNGIKYTGDLKERELNPEKATVMLDELLGPGGAELFQLALEEERYTKEYMNAVLNHSTNEVVDADLSERLILIVGGPSSSGKTYAAKEIVRAYLPLLKKPNVNNATSYVVSVDGGNFREISQIRKLVIKLAIDKGFTGISDLQRHGEKILDSAKKKLSSYLLQRSCKHSVVIPETFSKMFGLEKSFFAAINACDNAKIIFSKVEGENDNFKDVVAFMGSRRAWKTNWNEHFNPDINNAAGLPESKIYGAIGYVPGTIGTWRAQKKANHEPTIIFVNDLVLKKEQQQGVWIDATSTDQGAIKVSKRVFDKWQQSTKTVDLKTFSNDKENFPPPIMYFNGLTETFLQKNFPKLSALTGLLAQCNDKTARYLGGLVIDIAMNANWDSMIEQALLQVERYKRSQISRQQLSDNLKTCTNVGLLLDNSIMINNDGTIINPEIIEILEKLALEKQIMELNKLTQNDATTKQYQSHVLTQGATEKLRVFNSSNPPIFHPGIRACLGATTMLLISGGISETDARMAQNIANIELNKDAFTIHFKDADYARRLHQLLKDNGFNKIKYEGRITTTPYGNYQGSIIFSNHKEVKKFIEEICGYQKGKTTRGDYFEELYTTVAENSNPKEKQALLAALNTSQSPQQHPVVKNSEKQPSSIHDKIRSIWQSYLSTQMTEKGNEALMSFIKKYFPDFFMDIADKCSKKGNYIGAMNALKLAYISADNDDVIKEKIVQRGILSIKQKPPSNAKNLPDFAKENIEHEEFLQMLNNKNLFTQLNVLDFEINVFAQRYRDINSPSAIKSMSIFEQVLGKPTIKQDNPFENLADIFIKLLFLREVKTDKDKSEATAHLCNKSIEKIKHVVTNKNDIDKLKQVEAKYLAMNSGQDPDKVTTSPKKH